MLRNRVFICIIGRTRWPDRSAAIAQSHIKIAIDVKTRARARKKAKHRCALRMHKSAKPNANTNNCAELSIWGLASWKFASNGILMEKKAIKQQNDRALNGALSFRHLPVWWAIDI